MYVLGICCFYHDSSAALVKDGIVVAAAQEERFTRVKHDTDFPANAASYCLREAGITINDVDYIGFYEKPLIKFERLLSQHLEMFPKSFWSFYKAMPSWLNQKLRITSIVKKKLKYKGDIFFVSHHMAHAASSFLASPFSKAAIFTIDGVGEWTTAAAGIGEGNEITLSKEIRFPDSLGLLYSTATAHLGFSVNNSEYKVMGLSAYGKPKYVDSFRKIIDIKEDGSFKLDMDYFDYHYKTTMPGRKYIGLFGPVRKKSDPVTQKHKDIAASLQKITEEVVIKCLNSIQKSTGCDSLCISGGVALNSVCNGKILKGTRFKEIYINPDPGDGGTSMGVALYVYNTILGNKRKYVLTNPSLGPGYSAEEIKKFLDSSKIKYSRFKNENEMYSRVAKHLYEKKIVGWFQGRMEWGPRALGNRSILASPCSEEMRDILNAKVKHREMFRPFAPVICADDAEEYFECDSPLPVITDFMLMVYQIKKEKQKMLPAVTHVDGTGRLQSIRREQNHRYYDLIKEFEKHSGIPILVNTSFNIRGEPIVCTPEDAYRCMMGTGIDYLVMDLFFIKREDNPKDMWDSEKIAND